MQKILVNQFIRITRDNTMKLFFLSIALLFIHIQCAELQREKRAIGAFTTGQYATSFTQGSQILLRV